MALTASQLDQLHRTLLDSHNRDELRRLLGVCMSLNFDHIVADKALSAQVWHLVRCAAAEKPANSKLQALALDAEAWDPTPAPTAPSSGATPSSPTWSPASPPGTARPSPRIDGKVHIESLPQETPLDSIQCRVRPESTGRGERRRVVAGTHFPPPAADGLDCKPNCTTAPYAAGDRTRDSAAP